MILLLCGYWFCRSDSEFFSFRSFYLSSTPRQGCWRCRASRNI